MFPIYYHMFRNSPRDKEIREQVLALQMPGFASREHHALLPRSQWRARALIMEHSALEDREGWLPTGRQRAAAWCRNDRNERRKLKGCLSVYHGKHSAWD